MTENRISERRTMQDEQSGERLISNIRLVIGIIVTITTAGVTVVAHTQTGEWVPLRSHFATLIFLAYSVLLFYYVRRYDTTHLLFKYICVVLDITAISAIIWVGCTYPDIAPPVSHLSYRTLYYITLIMAGAFRYSVRCSYFSGIFAGVAYAVVVVANWDVLHLPNYLMAEGRVIAVDLPVYYEILRVLGIVITGVITGMISKHRLLLFSSMIESDILAARTASSTMEQTRNMANVIKVSTDEIFQSSKKISFTATNQATSIKQIKSTMGENTQIAGEIAEKTSSVANIATKMESDVINGFSLLEKNIWQMDAIKNKNDGVITGISELGNKITRIREFIKTINTVTDQTKVIAFNAALESASAGENGKRFSVVANEVNRLADDITVLTNKIRVQLEEIRDSSSQLIISGEESSSKIAEGNSLIRKLEDVFRGIRSGAEITANQAQMITVFTQKQQKSTEQINIAIGDISTGLASFLQSTEVTTASAESLSQMIEELGELINASIIQTT
jgi:methyl-accepting chemotaxis protein